jgi:hypothetical protein
MARACRLETSSILRRTRSRKTRKQTRQRKYRGGGLLDAVKGIFRPASAKVVPANAIEKVVPFTPIEVNKNQKNLVKNNANEPRAITPTPEVRNKTNQANDPMIPSTPRKITATRIARKPLNSYTAVQAFNNRPMQEGRMANQLVFQNAMKANIKNMGNVRGRATLNNKYKRNMRNAVMRKTRKN